MAYRGKYVHDDKDKERMHEHWARARDSSLKAVNKSLKKADKSWAKNSDLYDSMTKRRIKAIKDASSYPRSNIAGPSRNRRNVMAGDNDLRSEQATQFWNKNARPHMINKRKNYERMLQLSDRVRDATQNEYLAELGRHNRKEWPVNQMTMADDESWPRLADESHIDLPDFNYKDHPHYKNDNKIRLGRISDSRDSYKRYLANKLEHVTRWQQRAEKNKYNVLDQNYKHSGKVGTPSGDPDIVAAHAELQELGWDEGPAIRNHLKKEGRKSTMRKIYRGLGTAIPLSLTKIGVMPGDPNWMSNRMRIEGGVEMAPAQPIQPAQGLDIDNFNFEEDDLE